MFLDEILTPELPDSFEFELDDQTPVLVRPLSPDDAGRLRRGFEQLSRLARRRRFIDEQTELGEELLRQLLKLDQVNNAAWGCLNTEKPQEAGVGVARYNRINGDRSAADVAITVADDYQGRGAGQLLHACLHLTAHRAGIQRFYYDVLSDNERFLKQLRALGATFEGRAANIDRLSMPVYHRPWDVPKNTSSGQRFADILRRIAHAQAVTA